MPEPTELVDIKDPTLESPTPTLLNQPTDGPSELEKRLQLLESVINEQRGEIEGLKKEKEKVPEKPQAEHDKEFYNSPAGKLKELISEQIKPLTDFIGGVQKQTLYDKTKAELKKDPRYKKIFDQAEDKIDHLMGSVELSNDSVILKSQFRGIITGVAGAISLGDFADIKPSGELPVNSREPAHLRPSAGPGPSPTPTDKGTREYTENELRYMREQRMTPQEYDELMDVDPKMVARHQPKPVK